MGAEDFKTGLDDIAEGGKGRVKEPNYGDDDHFEDYIDLNEPPKTKVTKHKPTKSSLVGSDLLGK